MNINSKWQKIILKFLEFALLAYLTYYIAINGQKPDLFIIIIINVILFILFLIDLLNTSKIQENISTLVKYFYKQNHFKDEDDVRITIHKKINKNKYKQFIDFYPQGTKKGKTYNTNKGIVKYAFESYDQEFSENFNDTNTKINGLMQKYNYNKEEAQKQVEDGEMSYYCRSIVVDNELWGVLYCTSKKSNIFPQQENLPNSYISENAKILCRMIEDELS